MTLKSLSLVSEKLIRLRNTPEYFEWRTRILKRDNNKCVLCNSSKDVAVDHIKPLALYPKLAFDIDNGRVLCQNCHTKTDTYGSGSHYKGDSPIHPILSGDLLYKISSLPTCIEIDNKELGFILKYVTFMKKWIAGYKGEKVDFIVKDKTLEKVIDKLFYEIRQASSYKNDLRLSRENSKVGQLYQNYLQHYIKENMFDKEIKL